MKAPWFEVWDQGWIPTTDAANHTVDEIWNKYYSNLTVGPNEEKVLHIYQLHKLNI